MSTQLDDQVYPGEMRDLLNTLDGARQQLADATGTDSPLFRFVHAAVELHELTALRAARVVYADWLKSREGH